MSTPRDAPEELALPDDLAESLGRAHARLGSFASRLLYFDSVGSTNDIADRLALAGAAEGTTVLAEMQTAGRGRMGRAWFSPPGAGLYASAVFRPSAAAATPMITLAAGAALADALGEATGLRVSIKWPNDLVVGRRKLGGILTEGSARQGALQHVIVGFGINLRPAAFPPEIADRATSVETELGRPVDRGEVLVAALAALGRARDDLRASRFGAILDRWRALAPTSMGAPVEWGRAADVRRGTTAGIDADGALLVRAGDSLDRIIAGEVRWL